MTKDICIKQYKALEFKIVKFHYHLDMLFKSYDYKEDEMKRKFGDIARNFINLWDIIELFYEKHNEVK